MTPSRHGFGVSALHERSHSRIELPHDRFVVKIEITPTINETVAPHERGHRLQPTPCVLAADGAPARALSGKFSDLHTNGALNCAADVYINAFLAFSFSICRSSFAVAACDLVPWMPPPQVRSICFAFSLYC